MTATLVIVGGGAMGRALAGGLIAGGWAAPEALVIVERLASLRDRLRKDHPRLEVTDSVVPAEGAVLAVKPADVESAASAVGAAGIGRVLSIAAGITTSQLEEWLAPGSAVVRAMPNTPAQIGAGASALASGSSTGEDDLAWAEGILGAVGRVVRVPEDLLDAVTGVSGSGPGYVFLLAEALEEAGVHVGIPRATARTLVVGTLLGAARMLAETGEEPRTLRAAVTSPAGTTAAGIRALEARVLRSAVLEAVVAATERSRQLGGPAS